MILIAVAIAAATLPGCAALFGGNRDADERFARPGQPRTSPSGAFVARADLGPQQNGVPTWLVVITDRAGRELFRDTEAYSSRHGVGITWLTGADQLWVLSSDVGTSTVQRDVTGVWSKRYPRPGHFNEDVPSEIRDLSGR
ncbi:MAG: hypothetical protein ACRDRP_03190 [Pseudonocardiaceae bacterium]